MSKPPWVGVGLDKPKPPAADGGERVLESLNATEISMFGVGAGVKGTLETWALKEANNLKPQL